MRRRFPAERLRRLLLATGLALSLATPAQALPPLAQPNLKPPLTMPTLPGGVTPLASPATKPKIVSVRVMGGCVRAGSRIEVSGTGFPDKVRIYLRLRQGQHTIALKTQRLNSRKLIGTLPSSAQPAPGELGLELYQPSARKVLTKAPRPLRSCARTARNSGGNNQTKRPRQQTFAPATTQWGSGGVTSGINGRLQPPANQPPGDPLLTAVPPLNPPPGNSPPPPGNDGNPPPPDEDGYPEDDWYPEDDAYDAGADGVAAPSSTGSLMDRPLPPPLESEPVDAGEDTPPDAVPGEFLMLNNDMDEARSVARTLAEAGFRIKRRRRLDGLGLVLSVFAFPPEQPVDEVVSSLRAQQPEAWLDANGYLDLQGNDAVHAWSLRAIGIAPEQAVGNGECSSGRRIGLLDGPIDLAHPALPKGTVRFRDLLPMGMPRPAPDHATAIALILLGKPQGPWHGLAPGAQVLAGGIVRALGERQATTVEWVLTGLDWLLRERVEVIALSLGTQRPNWLLEAGIRRVLEAGIPVLAAAGNGGPDAPPSYPAAYEGVIAVTAVNADGKNFERANRGDYIDLAAPGEEVWVPLSGPDGRFVSGTSYAVPFVAAALLRRPERELLRTARDLGAPGRDPVYGQGLLQWPPCPAAGR